MKFLQKAYYFVQILQLFAQVFQVIIMKLDCSVWIWIGASLDFMFIFNRLSNSWSIHTLKLEWNLHLFKSSVKAIPANAQRELFSLEIIQKKLALTTYILSSHPTSTTLCLDLISPILSYPCLCSLFLNCLLLELNPSFSSFWSAICIPQKMQSKKDGDAHTISS